MNLADKIIHHRKKNGWSQEELADRLDVSRQSVSKWEGGQSVPDISKIIQLSQLFGVSTDYLLKDGSEETKIDIPSKRLVTMEDAKEFLVLRRKAAKQISLATFLCILSPVTLILLGWLSEENFISVHEDIAGGAGLAVLLILVALACGLYITCGMRVKPFDFLETEEFDTEYGVSAIVRQAQKEFLPTYARYNTLGTMLCILSGVPLFIAICFGENTFWGPIGMGLLFPIVGIGVVFFIYGGVIWASMQKLLQEDDYTPTNKRINKEISAVSTNFWLLTTACYLVLTFLDGNWYKTWIIWPIAGLIYAAFRVSMKQSLKNKYRKL